MTVSFRDSDVATKKISTFLLAIDRLLFKKLFLSDIYLNRCKLFNACLVEGTGMIIYYALVPNLLNILLPRLGMFFAWNITTAIVIPFSFGTKYVIYDRWLFKE